MLEERRVPPPPPPRRPPPPPAPPRPPRTPPPVLTPGLIPARDPEPSNDRRPREPRLIAFRRSFSSLVNSSSCRRLRRSSSCSCAVGAGAFGFLNKPMATRLRQISVQLPRRPDAPDRQPEQGLDLLHASHGPNPPSPADPVGGPVRLDLEDGGTWLHQKMQGILGCARHNCNVGEGDARIKEDPVPAVPAQRVHVTEPLAGTEQVIPPAALINLDKYQVPACRARTAPGARAT